MGEAAARSGTKARMKRFFMTQKRGYNLMIQSTKMKTIIWKRSKEGVCEGSGEVRTEEEGGKAIKMKTVGEVGR